MIVESDPTFQDLIKLVLADDPHLKIVWTAGTGEEACDRVGALSPDVILIDFHLPGIDGFETGKRIKEQLPNVTIVMVTAHTEEVFARLAKEAQIDEVIPKSGFSLERVQRLLRRSHSSS